MQTSRSCVCNISCQGPPVLHPHGWPVEQSWMSCCHCCPKVALAIEEFACPKESIIHDQRRGEPRRTGSSLQSCRPHSRLNATWPGHALFCLLWTPWPADYMACSCFVFASSQASAHVHCCPAFSSSFFVKHYSPYDRHHPQLGA